jgi:hypothetical protein
MSPSSSFMGTQPAGRSDAPALGLAAAAVTAGLRSRGRPVLASDLSAMPSQLSSSSMLMGATASLARVAVAMTAQVRKLCGCESHADSVTDR